MNVGSRQSARKRGPAVPLIVPLLVEVCEQNAGLLPLLVLRSFPVVLGDPERGGVAVSRVHDDLVNRVAARRPSAVVPVGVLVDDLDLLCRLDLLRTTDESKLLRV